MRGQLEHNGVYFKCCIDLSVLFKCGEQHSRDAGGWNWNSPHGCTPTVKWWLQMMKFILMACVWSGVACWGWKSTETDGNFDIDTAGDHTNPTPPSEDTPLRDVCLSLPFTRRVGANVGWHSDTLADVFWHCEDPSCAFTYAMTQISILPHTPSTLIRVAQLNERLTSVSPWPQQPLHVSVHATLNLIAHWLDNDSKVGEVWMSIN